MSDFEKIWKVVDDYPSHFEPDVQAGIDRFKKRLASDKQTKLRVLQRRLLAAAATVGILFAFVTLWSTYAYSGQGAFAYNSNQPGPIELPDGTKVTLNKGSKLEFNWERRFAAKRIVNLSGEAFFEVRSQKNRPFEIVTPHSKLTVLGTSFNLKDYPATDLAMVEVAEGVVAFAGIDAAEKPIILKQNERGICNPNDPKKLYKTKMNDFNGNAWMTDQLTFRKTRFKEVVTQVQTYFQVDLEVMNKEILDCRFSSNFEDATIEKVLEVFGASMDLKAEKLDSNYYALYGGQCMQPNE